MDLHACSERGRHRARHVAEIERRAEAVVEEEDRDRAGREAGRRIERAVREMLTGALRQLRELARDRSAGRPSRRSCERAPATRSRRTPRSTRRTAGRWRRPCRQRSTRNRPTSGSRWRPGTTSSTRSRCTCRRHRRSNHGRRRHRRSRRRCRFASTAHRRRSPRSNPSAKPSHGRHRRRAGRAWKRKVNEPRAIARVVHDRSQLPAAAAARRRVAPARWRIEARVRRAQRERAPGCGGMSSARASFGCCDCCSRACVYASTRIVGVTTSPRPVSVCFGP